MNHYILIRPVIDIEWRNTFKLAVNNRLTYEQALELNATYNATISSIRFLAEHFLKIDNIEGIEMLRKLEPLPRE